MDRWFGRGRERGWMVVTGASRGIGEAIMVRLAAAGYPVFGVARSETSLQRICTKIRRSGGRADFLRADLSTADAARDLATDIRRRVGRVEGVVVNAGHSSNTLFENLTPEDMTSEFGVNYLAPATLLHSFIPDLKKQGRGFLVGVGSLTAGVPFPGHANYAASKAALYCLFRNLRIELAGTGVNVNMVLPGFTKTKMTEALDFRLPASEPDEVAEALVCAIKDNKAFVVPGFDNRMALTLNRLFPGAFDFGVSLLGKYFIPGYADALDDRSPE